MRWFAGCHLFLEQRGENAVSSVGELGHLGRQCGSEVLQLFLPVPECAGKQPFSLTQLETWGARGQPGPCAPDV